MKYHIITYGCQMNYSDSERIATILKLAKVTPVKDMNEADLLIINSCSVRQSAINRIYGQLINFRKNTKQNCHPEPVEGSPANAGKNRTFVRDSSVASLPQNDTKKTILTGCLLETDKKKLKDKFDLIIDIKELTNPRNNELKKLLLLVNPYASEQEFKAFDYTDYFKINPQYRSNFSAYIPIMTGCNNFCSYCAVPYTRGREVSRPAEEIIEEVKKLIEKGYKEITLLGQNVNSYKSEIKNPPHSPLAKGEEKSTKKNSSLCKGRLGGISITEQNNTITFPQLLKQINDIPGNFWIRFLTSHPKDMNDELIKTMTQCDKVCEYVHLPIQSGDDKILLKMNRRYTSVHYLKLINKIKKTYQSCHCEETSKATKQSRATCNKHGIATPRISEARNDKKIIWHPPIAISTDIIVGFPGETKAQFGNTAKIMRAVKYDMAYLAQYSPRTGTAAAKLKDNISIIEKKRRKEFLNDILRKTALANNKKYEGKIVEVLIEKVEGGIASGKTRTFKNVRIQNPPQSPFSKGGEKENKNNSHFAKGVKGISAKIKPGAFALIKITQANAWGLEGEIL